MVLTRNSCLSENFRKSKRILRDIKHQQELRPRVSIPDYREESPDEISYFRNILKVDIKNKNSLSHKLRIRTDNSKKTYKEIHRYQLRTTANDDSKCEVNVNVDCVPSSVHGSEHNTDNKRMEHLSRNNDDAVQLPHSLSVNPTLEMHEITPKQTTIFDVNKCKRTAFKRRLSSTFNKHSDLDNSQIRYDDDRRYPIRLRRRPREVYMVNTGYNSGKKANWHESLESPIRNCFKTSHHKKLEAYSKQSDTDDSDDLMNDEIKFENRKQRSMQRARLELKPINMSSNGMMTDLFNERTLARSSLADIEPMIIDKTITFDMVGGNRSCIQSLKESVVLPLIYPEVFEKLSISPPRGLLFYGSPGSGKTLMARALVNECSNSGTCKISFFMRKGADCLSKWVGESERQLRLLFDQAYRMRPSIIFFDEIDGLAPVRSARQDQIHSSIVSTLLSLIDGLDDRGQIIVIGATNRLDAIDPALRRPGRFDREFLFTLPEENVRKDILRIHTKHWQYPLSDMLVDELASISKGFSGADLKGLVIEAGLCALRRRYPQIYRSQKKLQLNMEEIYVKEEDFKAALKIIRPSSERSALPVHCKIPPRIRVLIESQYSSVKERISQLFQESVFTNFSDPLPKSSAFNSVFKLRLHVSGYEVDNLVSGLFHDIHNVNIYLFDSLFLSANTGLSVEEKLSHLFREAHKTPKSIIFLPHLDITFHGMCLGAQNMLLSMINGTVPNSDFNVSNILIMVTLSSNVNAWSDAEFDLSQSENMWQQLGQCFHSSTFTIDRPSLDQRTSYFSQLLEEVMKPVKSERIILSEKELCHEEELKEVEIKPLSLSKTELDKLEFEEDNILRKFRILLRQMLSNIAKDRKFQIFHKPVDESEVPDYYTIITNPMDLSTMRQKVDLYNYYTFDEFKTDLNLISANALLYNPAANSYLRDVRRHAYEFNDIAHSIFEEHFNAEFAKMVSDIHQSRVKRRYYENKKQSLAQQSSDILDFLTDLNGSKYEVNNGPLLKSQIDMYHNFYSKSSKTRVNSKAHSDTETVVTRTSLNDSVKCKSLCDVTDVDQSTEMIKMTLESFKKLTKTVDYEDEAAEKDEVQEDKDESMNECDTFDEEEVSSKPVIIDSGELKAVFRYAALKSDKWTIFQLEGLYCLLSVEIDKYQNSVDRTGLPENLRAIIDSYCGMIV